MTQSLLIRALLAVAAAAYRRSTSCTQNCNQGRCCTCRPTNLNTKRP